MSQLSCGGQCTRTLLFLLNIVFVICGLTLLGFGIYVNVSKKFEIALSKDINVKIVGGEAIEWVSITMIAVGAITVLVSGFGCLGAIAKNRVFLYFYAVILTLLIIVELGGFIAVFSSRVRVRDSYESGFRELFMEVYRNNHTDLRHFIEDVEREFKCCGARNVSDYYKNNFTIPAACHQNEDFRQPIFDKGCADAAIDWIWNEFPIIGGVLGGVILIEIFGVISSIALGMAISHTTYDEISNYRYN